MRRCITKDEIFDIMKAFHDKPCGGHDVAKRTTFKILTTGYYWKTLHKDSIKYIRSCDRCQRMGNPTRSDEISLKPQLTLAPFDKWGLDFIYQFSATSNQKEYILFCTNYLIKWVEVKALYFSRDGNVAEFLYKIFLIVMEHLQK